MLRARTVITGYAGSPCYNNLYGLRDDRPQDLLNIVGAFWTQVANVMGTDARIDIDPVCQVVDVATGTITGTRSGDPVGTISGSYAGEILPPATQGLIRLSTGEFVSGRELRGKVFIPYMPEGTAVAGRVAAGVIAVLQDGADQLVGDSLDTNNIVVWSKAHGVNEDVTSASVWSEFAVLRSRRD